MLTFYHAPQSRSSGVLHLLEEMNLEYELQRVDIRGEGGAPESYRAIQPNKKVPAIVHDGVIVTERAAICLYLGDAFPDAGLAPAPGDPDRARYLTALVYSDSVIDPCVAARVTQWNYQPSAFSFGSFDDMLTNVEKRLSTHPYAAGDRFTAADTQWAGALFWGIHITQAIPTRPAFEDYLGRIVQREAFQRYLSKDAA